MSRSSSIICFFLVCSSCLLFGQGRQKTKKHKSVASFASIEYLGYGMTLTEKHTYSDGRYNKNWDRSFGNGIGVSAGKALSKYWTVTGGVTFHKFTLKKVSGFCFTCPPFTWMEEDELPTFRKYKLKAITVPLEIRRYFGVSKFKLYAVIGLHLNARYGLEELPFVNSVTQEEIRNSRDDFGENDPLFNITAKLGAGLAYGISENFAVRIEPSFAYDLTGIQLSQGFINKYFISRLGLSAGIEYALSYRRFRK